MNLLQNNPYRQIGILVGATAREQDKQIKRLKQYIAAETVPENDFSFPIFGKIARTTESVQEAESKLNLDKDKIAAALFWFYSDNSITDEPAFQALKDNDKQKAIEIWTKLTAESEIVTKQNASAFHNLSTLLLSNLKNNREELTRILQFKLKFLESEFSEHFIRQATDKTFNITCREIQLLFLDTLQNEINTNPDNNLSSDNLIKTIDNIEFSAKKDFLKNITQSIIEKIERKVELTKSNRKNAKKESLKLALSLYKDASFDLNKLKDIVGTDNTNFASISDKVASEVLQSAIEYFIYCKEVKCLNTSTFNSNNIKSLIMDAKKISKSNIVKQRCDENIKELDFQIKISNIESNINSISRSLEKYSVPSNDPLKQIQRAKSLLNDTSYDLQTVKNALGEMDEMFVSLSTTIASLAQEICVSFINAIQQAVSNCSYDEKLSGLNILADNVKEALSISNKIQNMHLSSDFRQHYNENRRILLDFNNNLSQYRTPSNSYGSSRSTSSNYSSSSSSNYSSSSSGGCYIATMAYGDYNHPKVLALRKFRDDVLSKTFVGKGFINIYYFISPKLVKILQDKQRINFIIRKTLDKIVKFISGTFLILMFANLTVHAQEELSLSDNTLQTSIESTEKENVMRDEFKNIINDIALTIDNLQNEFKNTIATTNLTVFNLQSENKNLKSTISKLNYKLTQTTKDINELNLKIKKVDDNIIKTTNNIEHQVTDIQKTAGENFLQVNKSISNTIFFAIVGFIILVGGSLAIFLFLLKSKSDMTNKIHHTMISIDETLVEKFEKQLQLTAGLIQLIEQKKLTGQVLQELDHSLILKVANEINLLERNINLMSQDTKGLKQLKRSMEKLKDNLIANGYEMPELLGKQFHQGMKVVVSSSISDENLEKGQEIITKILIPQVNYNDKMIQTAQIEISVGV